MNIRKLNEELNSLLRSCEKTKISEADTVVDRMKAIVDKADIDATVVLEDDAIKLAIFHDDEYYLYPDKTTVTANYDYEDETTGVVNKGYNDILNADKNKQANTLNKVLKAAYKNMEEVVRKNRADAKDLSATEKDILG